MAPLMAHAQNDIRLVPLPDSIAYPEGVAVSPTTGQIYVNAAVTGVLAKITAASGDANVVSSPYNDTPYRVEGVNALGLKVDQQNRVWVAGGMTGLAYVVNAESGAVIARLTTPSGNALLNDVIFAGNSAYFTDTRRPVLWRANTESVSDGPLEAWLDLSNSPISYGDGANLNGITATADGRYLIVVHMQRGELFRIDTASRAISPIHIEGGALDGGDGLLLIGQRLFVVRQPAQEIVALNLSADYLHATEQKRINPPELAWPATAALSGSNLVIGNSQLNKRATNTPSLPFNLAIVPLALFD